MAKTRTKGRKRERRRFEYRKPSAEAIRKRATQRGTSTDGFIKTEYPIFQPKAGEYTLRFLPPTWDDPEHYGFDVYVHYGIGPDNASYLCLEKNRDEVCPICEEIKRLANDSDVDQDALRRKKAKKRVMVWLIDRDSERDGPMIWAMPWTTDRDITKVSQDRRTGEIFCVDDPEEGYDVDLERIGTGINTEYTGIKVANRPSPLSDNGKKQDKWLDFVVENPLPDAVDIKDAEYLESVLGGGLGLDEEEDDDEPKTRSSKRKSKSKGRRKPPKALDDDEDEDEYDDEEDEEDDDDEEDDEEDDDEEDEEDDEDDEDEDEEDDDEEDEAPKRRRGGRGGRTRVRTKVSGRRRRG